ncbi:MAG TPA: ABC transporter ATP-binding protein [Acidimicrobiales bacterium]|jgi:ATP-binding cassette subfamily B protein IrtB|nr:ABC transporter ATP-binding protein [Acidimicrobiales bacterium]
MIRILLGLVPDHGKPLLRRFVALLAATVVFRAATCVLLVPVLARLFSDDPGSAWGWIGAFTAALALQAFTRFRVAKSGFELGLTVVGEHQHRLVDHVAALPLGWLSGTRRAQAQRSIAATAPEVAQTIGNLVTPLVLAVALPPAIAIGLLFISWPLGLAALASAPLLVAAWWAGNRCSKRADAAFADSVTEVDDRVLEFARAQRALRGARRAHPEQSAAGRALADQHVATVSLLRWSVPSELLFSVASQLALLILAVVALAQLRSGAVSVAEAVALLVVVVRFLEPFTNLAELVGALQSSTTTLRGIDELLRAPALDTRHDLTVPGRVAGPPEVRLEGVRFRYPGATADAAAGLDMVAPAGSTTAIVGPSGAGKSTILGLVARFHDVTDGRVLVGGRDVRGVEPAELYADLSVVFQDVYLFEGTIRDNVLVAAPHASDTQLADVAGLSRVDEIVERLPAGWDTPVGEGGIALSGGERQRVGIARALLKEAPLLLVDEATSALDPENEQAVAAALADGRGRRTTLVVAHRMRTIEQADHVVFIDQGRVVESGPRDELLASGGRFADFHRDRVASGSWTIGRAAVSVP